MNASDNAPPRFWQFSLRWLVTLVFATGLGGAVANYFAGPGAAETIRLHAEERTCLRNQYEALKGKINKNEPIDESDFDALPWRLGAAVQRTKPTLEELTEDFGPPDPDSTPLAPYWKLSNQTKTMRLDFKLKGTVALFSYSYEFQRGDRVKGTVSGNGPPFRYHRPDPRAKQLESILYGMGLGAAAIVVLWFVMALYRRFCRGA